MRSRIRCMAAATSAGSMGGRCSQKAARVCCRWAFSMDWTSMGFVWKGGISGPGLKMDLNANIGLTFTPIEWGNEQKHILSAIPQGKSVFITGSAGTDPEDRTLAFLHRLGLALMMGRLVVLLPPYLIKGLSSRLEDQDANYMLIKSKMESFSGFQR
ncbi:hypothetical protein JHK84_057366 (mitochondrion) [Glycine max]|nr:hypothetical protein JHK85_051152 [Glycine max]KAG4936252.1 hypothetical protein JHK85_051171 [Glycine max]KAG4979099.1 hypothetical protein JHK85_033057 [Glycine max]KAG5070583.1 hypothetical protein JHK84_057366 [Glycine max]